MEFIVANCKLQLWKFPNAISQVSRYNSPIIRQQSIAQNKPASLITFYVVSPLEEPTLVRVSRGWSRGLRLWHHSSLWFHLVSLQPEGEKTNQQPIRSHSCLIVKHTAAWTWTMWTNRSDHTCINKECGSLMLKLFDLTDKVINVILSLHESIISKPRNKVVSAGRFWKKIADVNKL